MERKYYLRGLGIGIAVTALIMGIAASGNRTMTDEEVIARAKELGMVENTLLSDTLEDAQAEAADAMEQAEGNNASMEEDAAERNTAGEGDADQETDGESTVGQKADGENVAGQKTDGESVTGQKVDGESTAGRKTEEETESAAGNTAAEDNKTEGAKADKKEDITSAAIKTITVTNGDGSYTVARKLQEAGVVTSAENFDNYLCQYGYDKKLRTGTFSIPADASDEQIARIVTGAEP
ncbi:MAG: hypothetical protein J6A08_10600 [Lachnospiraceae bacterium]|nr:hypothetical protein [Lachnospiraceae bacterium]